MELVELGRIAKASRAQRSRKQKQRKNHAKGAALGAGDAGGAALSSPPAPAAPTSAPGPMRSALADMQSTQRSPYEAGRKAGAAARSLMRPRNIAIGSGAVALGGGALYATNRMRRPGQTEG